MSYLWVVWICLFITEFWPRIRIILILTLKSRLISSESCDVSSYTPDWRSCRKKNNSWSCLWIFIKNCLSFYLLFQHPWSIVSIFTIVFLSRGLHLTGPAPPPPSLTLTIYLFTQYSMRSWLIMSVHHQYKQRVQSCFPCTLSYSNPMCSLSPAPPWYASLPLPSTDTVTEFDFFKYKKRANVFKRNSLLISQP